MSLQDKQKEAPPEIRVVINFLRSKNGPKLRTGVLGGKRVEYFKGACPVAHNSYILLLTVHLRTSSVRI